MAGAKWRGLSLDVESVCVHLGLHLQVLRLAMRPPLASALAAAAPVLLLTALAEARVWDSMPRGPLGAGGVPGRPGPPREDADDDFPGHRDLDRVLVTSRDGKATLFERLPPEDLPGVLPYERQVPLGRVAGADVRSYYGLVPGLPRVPLVPAAPPVQVPVQVPVPAPAVYSFERAEWSASPYLQVPGSDPLYERPNYDRPYERHLFERPVYDRPYDRLYDRPDRPFRVYPGDQVYVPVARPDGFSR